MSNVEFEDEQNLYTSRKILGEQVVPGMVGFLTKRGFVKNGKQAEYILIAVIIICVSLTIYFGFFRNSTIGSKKVVPDIKSIFRQPSR